MKFRVVHQPTTNAARSPFRLVEQATGREGDWVNQDLECECLRRVAPLIVRRYAHVLLYIRSPLLRIDVHHTATVEPDALTDSILLDYVRFQSSQQPVSGATINLRVNVVDRALRYVFPDAPQQVAPPSRKITGATLLWASG